MIDRRELHGALLTAIASLGTSLFRLASKHLGDTRVPVTEKWLQWGGATRDFCFSLSNKGEPIRRPQLLWQRTLGKGQSAVVSDGRFAFSHHLDGEQEVLSKWNLANGESDWQFRYDIGFHSFAPEYDGPHSTPAISNGCLFVVSIDAQIHAIDLDSGKPRWRTDLRELCGTRIPQSGYASSPLIWKNRLILPTIGESTKQETEPFVADPKVPAGRRVIPGAVAIDLTTGTEIWRTETFRGSHSSPIAVEIDNQPMIVFHTMFELIGVDPINGAILWRQLLRRSAADNVSFTPLWDEVRNQFLICHGYCDSGAQAVRLKRVNSRWQTEIAWTNARMRVVHTNGVISGTTLLGSNREPSTLLVGIDIRNGNTLFRQRGLGKSNFLVSGSQLLVLNENGELIGCQPGENGIDEFWRLPAMKANAWTVPSIVGDMILLRDMSQIKAYRFPKL